MSPHISILFFLAFLSYTLFGQVNHLKAYQIVLNRSKIEKAFSFVQSKKILVNKTWLHNYDSLVLTYLGKIKTTDGRVLKFVTSRWYWNTSPRATSRIIIFNAKNQYLGDYYLTMTYDVPDKIEDHLLVFINEKQGDCTPNLVTKVNFKRGIPKRFFLKCKDNMGDLYSFAQNL
jgi:hypothetical protein